MDAGFTRDRFALALHVLGLLALLVVWQQVQLPGYAFVIALLGLSLWPWLGPWRRPAAVASAAAPRLRWTS
ncbi:hypothetical protein [Pseudomonas sp. OHS18]|uniref:hypothetical protein n=1 Tax=Pseudomonas sp. OHS18 TaxID=3399679 RepID=UPI003A8A9898